MDGPGGSPFKQEMTTYRHTQRGTVILVTLLLMTGVFIGLGLTVVRPLLFATALLVLTAWLFNSLTVEIAEGRLQWRFGPGIVGKSVSLDEISRVEPVRTNFIEGWGIHLSRFGWLYNVSGWDAVAITLKNGKRFALGTDEPQALAAAIEAGLSRT